MFKNKKLIYISIKLLILSAVFFVSACKSPNDVGLDVVPLSDVLNSTFSDTATISATTIKEDSLRSDEVSKVLIGSINDADFGISNASLYTQVILSATPSLSSGGTLVGDSVVIAYQYSGYYGSAADTLTPLTLHIYKMLEDVYYDSAYYTTRNFVHDNTVDLANNYTFTPHPTDSVMVGTANQPAQLRINLGKPWADTLVSYNTLPVFSSNTNWLQYLKGFFIKVDNVSGTNAGTILYFDPLGTYSKMTLYYHEIGATDTTYKTYDFTYNGAARINHDEHDFTGSSAGLQMANPSSNDSLIYIQSMCGLKSKITFPYFNNFTDSNKIIINRAQLVLTVPTSSTDHYVQPDNLLFAAYDSIGGLTYVSDFFDPLVTFGGTYSPTPRTYTFNIARHLQRILDGKISNYGFSLNMISSVVQGNRVILGSGKQGSSVKMKLNLFYTKIPQAVNPSSSVSKNGKPTGIK